MQARIDECETMTRKFSSELMHDSEAIKGQVREYVGTYFDEGENKMKNLASIVVCLTESMLLEQGIS